MKIVVAGVGYVGLVTAVTLADVGHDVICLDVDKGKLKMLKEGISPIYEYGLDRPCKRVLCRGGGNPACPCGFSPAGRRAISFRTENIR